MLTTEERQRFQAAYTKALSCEWKGGDFSVSRHLKRRIKRKHLPFQATEMELIQKGLEVLQSADAVVYEYKPTATFYFVVHKDWCVFFDEDGMWDTAFPPDSPQNYFASRKGYRLLGTLKEVLP